MSLTTPPLIQKDTENNQEHAFSELKSLLSELALNHDQNIPNKLDLLSGFHSKLVDEAIVEKNNSNVTKPSKAKEKINLFSYLSGVARSSISQNETNQRAKGGKVESDTASIYEDDKCQTKTIYRSNSFDDSEDELVVEENCKNKESWDNDSIHGFHLEDFSDTFNLDDESDEEKLNLPKHSHQKSQKSLRHETDLPSDNKKLVDKLSTEVVETFPSVGSNGSFQFNDILTGDILGELESAENFDIKSDRVSSSSSLSLDEDKLVNLIVAKLKEQLQPTLEKLSQESEKYELIKTVYKLPSVSNLNDEIKLKYNGKGKSFNLDFDKSMIGEMVKKEMTKNERRKKQFNQVSVISAEDQIRLNFNKFRQLNTIIEEQDSDKSFEKLEMLKQNFLCMSKSYMKSKDTRRVQDLETQELIILLQQIKEGKLKDMSKVEHLVTMFEEEKEDNINRLDNQKLKSVILLELNRRRVI